MVLNRTSTNLARLTILSRPGDPRDVVHLIRLQWRWKEQQAVPSIPRLLTPPSQHAIERDQLRQLRLHNAPHSPHDLSNLTLRYHRRHRSTNLSSRRDDIILRPIIAVETVPTADLVFRFGKHQLPGRVIFKDRILPLICGNPQTRIDLRLVIVHFGGLSEGEMVDCLWRLPGLTKLYIRSSGNLDILVKSLSVPRIVEGEEQWLCPNLHTFDFGSGPSLASQLLQMVEARQAASAAEPGQAGQRVPLKIQVFRVSEVCAMDLGVLHAIRRVVGHGVRWYDTYTDRNLEADTEASDPRTMVGAQ